MNATALNVRLGAGFEKTDRDHLQLLELVNQLQETLSLGKICEGLPESLASLACAHFYEEEALMAYHHYPDLDPHRKMHAAFISQAEDLEVLLAQGDWAAGVDLLALLRNWLIKHIQLADRDMAQFINGHQTLPGHDPSSLRAFGRQKTWHRP